MMFILLSFPGLPIVFKDLKIEGDVQETVEPEDDLDIMLGKKKKRKTAKFTDEDEVLDKDEGNFFSSVYCYWSKLVTLKVGTQSVAIF